MYQLLVHTVYCISIYVVHNMKTANVKFYDLPLFIQRDLRGSCWQCWIENGLFLLLWFRNLKKSSTHLLWVGMYSAWICPNSTDTETQDSDSDKQRQTTHNKHSKLMMFHWLTKFGERDHASTAPLITCQAYYICASPPIQAMLHL